VLLRVRKQNGDNDEKRQFYLQGKNVAIEITACHQATEKKEGRNNINEWLSYWLFTTFKKYKICIYIFF